MSLPRPYVPVITTTGFQGCLDIATSINNVRFPVLGPGDFFDAYYFNSTVQKGLSYTCLLSVSSTKSIVSSLVNDCFATDLHERGCV